MKSNTYLGTKYFELGMVFAVIEIVHRVRRRSRKARYYKWCERELAKYEQRNA